MLTGRDQGEVTVQMVSNFIFNGMDKGFFEYFIDSP